MVFKTSDILTMFFECKGAFSIVLWHSISNDCHFSVRHQLTNHKLFHRSGLIKLRSTASHNQITGRKAISSRIKKFVHCYSIFYLHYLLDSSNICLVLTLMICCASFSLQQLPQKSCVLGMIKYLRKYRHPPPRISCVAATKIEHSLTFY